MLISRPLLICFVVKNSCFVRVENRFSHWGATFIRALSATTAGCSLRVCVVCSRCVNLVSSVPGLALWLDSGMLLRSCSFEVPTVQQKPAKHTFTSTPAHIHTATDNEIAHGLLL